MKTKSKHLARTGRRYKQKQAMELPLCDYLTIRICRSFSYRIVFSASKSERNGNWPNRPFSELDKSGKQKSRSKDFK